MLKDTHFYAKRLKIFYESLGFFVEIEDEDDNSDWAPIAMMISDDPELECDWKNGEITSFYFWFYPQYKRAQKEEDVKMLVNMSSMGIKKADRGKGLASKMVDGMIKIFGDDLGYIEADDLNRSGIWQYIASKYPHIEWNIKTAD